MYIGASCRGVLCAKTYQDESLWENTHTHTHTHTQGAVEGGLFPAEVSAAMLLITHNRCTTQ